MRRWLRAAWQFLRELSGEAALERRMQAHQGPCAVHAAMSEACGNKSRCC